MVGGKVGWRGVNRNFSDEREASGVSIHPEAGDFIAIAERGVNNIPRGIGRQGRRTAGR